MTDNKLVLTGNLLLRELSDKKFPEIVTYKSVKVVDLQSLENIDSAGLAYLVQIKSQFPDLCFTGVSENSSLLANLYGLHFLFK